MDLPNPEECSEYGAALVINPQISKVKYSTVQYSTVQYSNNDIDIPMSCLSQRRRHLVSGPVADQLDQQFSRNYIIYFRYFIFCVQRTINLASVV